MEPCNPVLIVLAAYEKYSASIEAIRKQTLALGNIVLEESENNDQPIDFQSSSSSSSSFARSPVNHTSNLSLLFQHANYDQTPPATPNVAEDTPLLGQSQPDLAYHSIHVSSELSPSAIAPQIRNPPLKKSPWQHVRESAGRGSNIWNHAVKNIQMLRPKDIWREAVLVPMGYIPAVILGLLLNLLDAISYGKHWGKALSLMVTEKIFTLPPRYHATNRSSLLIGMITFPTSNPIFANFGPDGISMFFVRWTQSCRISVSALAARDNSSFFTAPFDSSIVAQLTYSCGGSVFGGGNGR